MVELLYLQSPGRAKWLSSRGLTFAKTDLLGNISNTNPGKRDIRSQVKHHCKNNHAVFALLKKFVAKINTFTPDFIVSLPLVSLIFPTFS